MIWWPELAQPNQRGLRSLPSLRRAAAAGEALCQLRCVTAKSRSKQTREDRLPLESTTLRQRSAASAHSGGGVNDLALICNMLGADIVHWILRCLVVCDQMLWCDEGTVADAQARSACSRVLHLLRLWQLDVFRTAARFHGASALLQEHTRYRAPLVHSLPAADNCELHLLWTLAVSRQYVPPGDRHEASRVGEYEARRCAAGLRFALLRFTMQRLVAQHLAAIKARLWRPDGRLAQRQAADVLPVAQVGHNADLNTDPGRRADRGWKETKELRLWRQMQAEGTLFRT